MSIAGFDYTGEHWATISLFDAWLSQQRVPTWARGVTVHHTWRPLPSDWRGKHSIDGLARYYRDTRKWSAGPHFFVAPDGIWQLTPLPLRGIHAGACNAHSYGVEVVGDYDRQGWQEPIRSLAFGMLRMLLTWLQKTPFESLTGHRECLPNKTCPGSAIDLDTLRSALHLDMSGPTVPQLQYQVIASAGLNVRTEPRLHSTKLGALTYHTIFAADHFIQSDVRGIPQPGTSGWLHLIGGGWVFNQYVQPVVPLSGP